MIPDSKFTKPRQVVLRKLVQIPHCASKLDEIKSRMKTTCHHEMKTTSHHEMKTNTFC